ncbi:MAG: hypothetical protein JSW71_09130 [Gemmatimonadota bacterium]|nr:MAG: hypothetical protein JSW71_09130 [Gemmatimonadota bacterium]
MFRNPMLVSACLWGVVCAESAAGQEPAADTTTQALFVFLDCNAPNCDFDHFRREITWINWARDRQDADLHLLITAQRTGGGGWQYTLDYLGRRSFDGVAKSTLFVSDPDDTDTEIRDGLTQSIALGLVQFVEATPLAPRLRVMYEAPELVVVEREENDPWNLWVFRIGAEGDIDGESQERGYSIEGYASADRVSEDLKINFSLSGEYDHEEFDEVEEGVTFVNTAEDYAADLLMVWSLGDHWSAGGRTHVNRSTFLNRDLAMFAGPALEYDIFPYSESTRRAIVFLYSIELAVFNYELETVEGKTEEVLPRHSLLITAAVQQPWGEIFGSVEGIQYLHDPATHRINTFLDIEYRLFRGLNLEISGSFSRIKDQFYLPAEDLTPEEILLRRRQRGDQLSVRYWDWVQLPVRLKIRQYRQSADGQAQALAVDARTGPERREM